MTTLLYEIGIEELPASFIRGALAAMPKLAAEALAHARIDHGAITALGSPRRLALSIADLAPGQRDVAETVMGPPERAAFEEDGTPKKAALGFAKKLGLDVSELTIEETDKGRYVAGRREEKGQPSVEILPELLARLTTKIPFPKSMRWGAGEIAFGRPVHWIVCLYGADVVGAEFAGVAAGRESRGHRFLAPEAFELADADAYVARLREAHVLVDPAERERVMKERLAAAAADAGATLVEDEFLVGENAGLVEEPHVVRGSFDRAFLALPDAVIIDVMRDHQRYFALRSADGALEPAYLCVTNTDKAPAIIAKGNDRVLHARLADAAFFVREDQQRGLAHYAAQLGAIVFQAKLGSVGERAQRLASVVAALGDEGPAGEAAALCKADLASLIVGEFPDLQGMMGRFYAEAEGIDPVVAEAMADHYLPRGATDEVPTSEASARLAIADRADVLVGCFGLGQEPSGSADPFALRRAAIGVVRIALEGPLDVDLRQALEAAHAAYRAQDKPVGEAADVIERLDGFFRGRLRVFHGQNRETGVVRACLGAWEGGSLRDLSARLDALEAFAKSEAYESLAVAFKRAFNIAKDAPEGAFDEALAAEDAEKELASVWASLAPRIEAAVAERAYERALGLVSAELRAPIDRFFDEVFVMVDDAAVRDNRLRLLGSIATTLTAIAHFHEL